MAAGARADPTYGEVVGSLRDYVTGPETMKRADTTVLCKVTHSNLKLRIIELRFDLHQTVDEAKGMLYSYCGSKTSAMRLEVYNGDDLKCVLADDSKKLGFYSLCDGDRVHIVDTDPHSLSKDGGLDDLSQVEKYVMSDEEYDKRAGTLRAWKKEQLKADPTFTFAKFQRMQKARGEIKRLEKLGHEVPEELEMLAEGKDPEIEKAKLRGEARVAARRAGGGGGEDGEEEAEGGEGKEDGDAIPKDLDGVEVGMRCEVFPGARRGEVGYVGKVEGAKGWWVGVKYDEPVGKNDGTHKGKRYFEALPNYAAFVKPHNVKVGEYPPIDDLEEDEDDEL